MSNLERFWWHVSVFCYHNNPWWIAEAWRLCWHSTKEVRPRRKQLREFADYYWYSLKHGFHVWTT